LDHNNTPDMGMSIYMNGCSCEHLWNEVNANHGYCNDCKVGGMRIGMTYVPMQPWEEPFELAEGVTLQPADIRELQLAKAAVRAGAETLLAASGVSAAELDGVYLTGGFGAGLNIKNAIALGILPEVSAEKIRVLGNCSGAGAVRALLEPTAYGSLKSAAAKAQTVSLDGNPEFTERFMEYMYF